MKTALIGVGALGLAAGLWWLLRPPTAEETARRLTGNSGGNANGGRQLVVMPVLTPYLSRPAAST